jgi:hypothetical protein
VDKVEESMKDKIHVDNSIKLAEAVEIIIKLW